MRTYDESELMPGCKIRSQSENYIFISTPFSMVTTHDLEAFLKIGLQCCGSSFTAGETIIAFIKI